MAKLGLFDVARFHDVLISVRDAGTLVFFPAPIVGCSLVLGLVVCYQ